MTTQVHFGTADGVSMQWAIKASSANIGPGPNLFSDLESDVWTNYEGLHLTITERKGRWWCTEVTGNQPLGYGTYRWIVGSNLSNLDVSVVLGLFIWDDMPDQMHREIDIEFARWGNAGNPYNGQFTVQPWDRANHQYQFAQSDDLTSTHEFTWMPGQVAFRSWAGEGTDGTVLVSWTYSAADVPSPGGEHPRMNLWLDRGSAPSSSQRVHLLVKDFIFTRAD